MLRYLIREVENGWTLTTSNPWEDEHRKVTVEVFEVDGHGSRKEECEALKRLLWSIADKLLPYDKFSKHNVMIEIKAGHKVCDEDELEQDEKEKTDA